MRGAERSAMRAHCGATGHWSLATGQNETATVPTSSLQPPASRPKSARGFTLIEVLAALVIVALGMLGVIEAVSQTASNGSYLRDKSLAHWVAMNQLAQVRLAPQPPKIDKSSDEVEMADRRWRWTMDVTQSPLESVRRIDIRVGLAEGPEDASLASITGFYGAAIAPAGSTIVLWQGSVDEQSQGQQTGDKDKDRGKKDEELPPADPPSPSDPVEQTDPPADSSGSQ